MASFNEAFMQEYLEDQRRRKEDAGDHNSLSLRSLIGQKEYGDVDNRIRLLESNSLLELLLDGIYPLRRQPHGAYRTMKDHLNWTGEDKAQTWERKYGDDEGRDRLYTNNSSADTDQQQFNNKLLEKGVGTAYLDPREQVFGSNLMELPMARTVNNQLQNYGQLNETLKQLRNEHTGILGKVGWYVNDHADALNTITNYDETIGRVSSEIGIPKELLQATLFRELIFYSPPDATDYARLQSGISDNPSLGLGQVTPKTGIKAEVAARKREGIPEDEINTFGIPEMGSRLQDPTTNIYYTAMVLAKEAEELGIDLKNTGEGDIKKVLAAYNGSGDAAQRYGRETYLYYDVFKQKNLSYNG